MRSRWAGLGKETAVCWAWKLGKWGLGSTWKLQGCRASSLQAGFGGCTVPSSSVGAPSCNQVHSGAHRRSLPCASPAPCAYCAVLSPAGAPRSPVHRLSCPVVLAASLSRRALPLYPHSHCRVRRAALLLRLPSEGTKLLRPRVVATSSSLRRHIVVVKGAGTGTGAGNTGQGHLVRHLVRALGSGHLVRAPGIRATGEGTW